jgi:hypothetical protein
VANISEGKAVVQVCSLPDGAWFEGGSLNGVLACVGQKLLHHQDGDTKVRFIRRWGAPSKEEMWISSASPVTRVAEPHPAAPVAEVAVAPEFGIAPQEVLVDAGDPFGEYGE